MKYRKLGRTGFEVGDIAHGLAVVSLSPKPMKADKTSVVLQLCSMPWLQKIGR
jgi:aryl-alcohol dehydrogenase-like predicted oxidoreductase